MKVQNFVKIIIPVYKSIPSDIEKMSFLQCLKILGDYSFVLVFPEDLDISFYTNIHPDVELQSFPKKYFDGIEGYNELMLSSGFYERFLDTKYLLIHQLDVFVFKDELTYWCNKEYDYIGAPWIATPRNSFFPRLNRFLGKVSPREFIFYKVGNGGFSLRKTKSFFDLASQYQKIIFNYLQAEEKELFATEDVFWSLKIPELSQEFSIPDYKEAVAFAMDRKPDIAMKINEGKLPFGCHGFQKPRVKKFWEPIINKEYTLMKHHIDYL